MISERNIRIVFNDSTYIRDVLNPRQQGFATTAGNKDGPAQENHDSPGLQENNKQELHTPNRLSKITDILFNKNINTNLESTLWDVSWFTPIKEFKAAVNYNLFGIVDKGVYVSTDRRRLYYNETIDTSYMTSSFKTISDNAVDRIINKMNGIYLKARSFGFRKVYLSIIPSPVSLLEPRFQGRVYNGLIERIQNSPRLKMPCINLLPVFNTSKDSVYAAADTHWTPLVAQIWLDQFNQELYKTVEEH